MVNYCIVSEQESHIDIDAYAGSNLDVVVKEALTLSQLHGKPVKFNFNGVDLEINESTEPHRIIRQYHNMLEERHNAYLNSPEGKQAELAATIRKQQNNDELNDMLSNFENAAGHPDTLIEWLGAFSLINDHIGMEWDKQKLIKDLTDLGYKSNDCVGDNHVSTDKVIFARWLVGQCISTLESMGAIHPIADKFSKDYKDKFVNVGATSLTM